MMRQIQRISTLEWSILEMSNVVTIENVLDVNALWHMSNIVLLKRVGYLVDVIS